VTNRDDKLSEDAPHGSTDRVIACTAPPLSKVDPSCGARPAVRAWWIP